MGLDWILNKEAQILAHDISKNYTGRLSQSIEGSGKDGEITIKGEHYAYFKEHGRRPTSQGKRGRLYGVMLSWLNSYPQYIPSELSKKTFAWLVARKVDRVGYPSDGGRMKKTIDYSMPRIVEAVKGEFINEIKTEVLKSWRSPQQ